MMKQLLLFCLFGGFTCFSNSVAVDYYGQKLLLEQVNLRSSICNSSGDITKELAKIKALNATNFAILDSFSVVYKLDGVGIYLLLKKVSLKLANDDLEAVLFSYSYLSRIYDVVLLYNDLGDLGIGYGSDINFSSPSVVFKGQVYYTFRKSKDGIKQFKIFFDSKTDKKFDYLGVPSFKTTNLLKKSIQFDFYDETIDTVIVEINGEEFIKTHKKGTRRDTLQIQIDSNTIAYYTDIPKILNYEYYVLTSSSSIFYTSLMNALEKKMESFSELEKIKYLLSITQSLPYDAVGERFYFPEETLFYEKSDCADRTFLLSYFFFISSIKIKTYIIDNPHHLTVGIKCTDVKTCFKPKKTFLYKNECYFLAEPTGEFQLGTYDNGGRRPTGLIPNRLPPASQIKFK